MLPKKTKDTRVTFQSVKHRKVEYQVGECVFLQQPDEEPQPFIAKITRIWCDKKRIKQAAGKALTPNKLTVQWFYRPEDTQHNRKSFHGRNELYTSNHADDVDVHSLLGKCRVHTLKDFLDLQAVDEDADFFSRFTYNPRSMDVNDEPVPVYCLCNMPFNPDLVMIQCTHCEEWYHLGCVHLTEEDANQMGWHYTCSVCHTKPEPIP